MKEYEIEIGEYTHMTPFAFTYATFIMEDGTKIEIDDLTDYFVSGGILKINGKTVGRAVKATFRTSWRRPRKE